MPNPCRFLTIHLSLVITSSFFIPQKAKANEPKDINFNLFLQVRNEGGIVLRNNGFTK